MASKDSKTNNSGAAIVCKHIALEDYPILFASRDEPVSPEDSGWQFLCNSGQDENDDDARVWSISTVLNHDPTLFDIVKLPSGTTLVRKSRQALWMPL